MLLFPEFLSASADFAVGLRLGGPLAAVREMDRHCLVDRMIVRLDFKYIGGELNALTASTTRMFPRGVRATKA